jgi:hypothetical protein
MIGPFQSNAKPEKHYHRGTESTVRRENKKKGTTTDYTDSRITQIRAETGRQGPVQ